MYVTLEEHYAEQREAGRAEGREEGKEEGKAEGRAEEREENLKTLSDNLFSSGICRTRSEADTKALDLLKKRDGCT